MGNKQTIFTAQQLDAYQVGVSPVSISLIHTDGASLTNTTVVATGICKQD